MSEALTDREVLARQYADDQNLRARQRLWEISRSEPQLDFNAWSVDLMAVRDEDVVLDVGCGNGRPLALLRERCTTVGIDLSLGMVQGAGSPLVAVADAEHLPFPDGTFDGAAALMMLYHVPNQEAAAAELRRVVKRGGVVVATTASQENQPELRTLIEQAVGHGWTWNRPSTTSFHLEGGADVLGTVFDSIQIVYAPERRIFITDPGAAADYVASSADHFARTLPPGRTWDDVVGAVRVGVAQAVAEGGALIVTARLGALVCR